MKPGLHASIAIDTARVRVARCGPAALPAPARRLRGRLLASLALLVSMAGLIAPAATRAATVWTGPKLVFSKADGADPRQAANQDRLTSRVWLTRGLSQGLYNAALESSFTHVHSPADTEWATGTTANHASLQYADWETWVRTVGNPPGSVGVNAVLHLKTDDIYIDIRFLSWSQRNSGGLSYERSTPGADPAVSDCLFDWAEQTYPELFAPAAASATSAPYYYRFYAHTGAYLGTSSIDSHVYYLGPVSNGALLDLGGISSWVATAGCP